MALPRRTLEYLQRGASEGMRNAELFDATCQFRDAGHSQEDAEAQLRLRYQAFQDYPVTLVYDDRVWRPRGDEIGLHSVQQIEQRLPQAMHIPYFTVKYC